MSSFFQKIFYYAIYICCFYVFHSCYHLRDLVAYLFIFYSGVQGFFFLLSLHLVTLSVSVFQCRPFSCMYSCIALTISDNHFIISMFVFLFWFTRVLVYYLGWFFIISAFVLLVKFSFSINSLLTLRISLSYGHLHLFIPSYLLFPQLLSSICFPYLFFPLHYEAQNMFLTTAYSSK